jgi:hypothetical protein
MKSGELSARRNAMIAADRGSTGAPSGNGVFQ